MRCVSACVYVWVLAAHELERETSWRENHWWYKRNLFFFSKTPRLRLAQDAGRKHLWQVREEYLKTESTNTHKEDTDVQIKWARQERKRCVSEKARCRKKSARCRRTCFGFSKLPSVCSWEEATLDAAYSVWPQGSVSVWTSLRSNPVRSLPVLQSTAGRHWVRIPLCGYSTCETPMNMKLSCGEGSLYREPALDPASFELLTWLVMLSCGVAWKCADTRRGFRSQTLGERRFCDYTAGTLTYKWSYSWNASLYSSRALKWTWMGAFTPLVMLPAFT